MRNPKNARNSPPKMKSTIPIASRSRFGGVGGGNGGGPPPHPVPQPPHPPQPGGGPQAGGCCAPCVCVVGCDGPVPTGVVGRGSFGSEGFMVRSGKHALGGPATGKREHPAAGLSAL